MKKIIFILLFILPFCVKGEVIDTTTYNRVSNKLNEAYDKFIGACNPYERLAIIEYADGELEKLSDGYDTIKGLVTKGGNVINDFCANYSEDLYDTLKETEDYIGGYQMYSLMLESDYTIKKNVFVSGNKILSDYKITIVDDCDLIDNKMVSMIKKVIFYVQLLSVSLTIILCVVDLYKAFVSKEIDGKKAFKNIKSRVVALVVILLAPVIINIIIDLLNRYISVDSLNCLES